MVDPRAFVACVRAWLICVVVTTVPSLVMDPGGQGQADAGEDDQDPDGAGHRHGPDDLGGQVIADRERGGLVGRDGLGAHLVGAGALGVEDSHGGSHLARRTGDVVAQVQGVGAHLDRCALRTDHGQVGRIEVDGRGALHVDDVRPGLGDRHGCDAGHLGARELLGALDLVQEARDSPQGRGGRPDDGNQDGQAVAAPAAARPGGCGRRRGPG